MQSLKVLVATGVDPHVKDLDGMTPADLAEECGHSTCSVFLSSYQPRELPKVKVLLYTSPMYIQLYIHVLN